MNLYQDIGIQEWKNQKQDGKRYFHKFHIPPKSVAGWSTLTSSPYLDIFVNKFTHMEQAGIMDRLQRQYTIFKPMELEPLEPLKLEHFYITLIGIAVGTFLALVSFVAERMAQTIVKSWLKWHGLKQEIYECIPFWGLLYIYYALKLKKI